MVVHPSQQFQSNRIISEELHETFNLQEGLQGLADLENSGNIQAACNNQGIQQSMTYTGGNLFQGEHHGEYSYLENTNTENSTFTNQYLANDESLPLIQQRLQENGPIHPTQVYQSNRMISEELPETI
ncbi:hypothetical protein AVEN_137313-1 [Araneus ventricosus]|uniref:Uncharacterized protein n=1 Tax=Araneus ventricosus TaxID=182803 RepID=A0A4Y2FJQ5_ARAVE|nr:hypothetical protein AVEN_137313-1 [Araneus ventricosus]